MTKHVLVYGVHAVHALLVQRHRVTHQIYMNSERRDTRMQELLELIEEMNIPIQYLSTKALDQRFPGCVHQGVVAEADLVPAYTENNLESLLDAGKRLSTETSKPLLILLLDGVTDPQNLGACLRSADAAGVDFVIIPKDKSATITPVVSKVACGACETIPVVRVTNLVRAIELLKKHGVWVYGAAGEANESIYDLDAQRGVAIVMGAEGSGLRRLTRDSCDGLFSIPMVGSVSSLNVSVATGICLYEVLRQRL